MPDPDRPGGLFAIIQCGKGVAVVAAGQFAAEGRIERLDVEQKQIRPVDDRPGAFQGDGTGGVERGVETGPRTPFEDVAGEFRLHQRFSARQRDAAGADEVPAGFDFTDHFGGGDFHAAPQFPGVGIVAVAASQRTALQEYDETHSRAVQRTEALKRMHPAGHAFHRTLRTCCGRCG